MFLQEPVGKPAKANASSAKTRRQPSQARSQRRYEAIVGAAAAAFADFGFEATTMEGIAARADTSIGSLYQFFPNKRALFRVIAQSCLEKSRDTMQRMLAASFGGDWRTLLHRVIDGYRDLQRDVFMQAIWRNLHLYSEWIEQDEAMFREFVGVTAGLIGTWAPSLSPEHRRMIGITIVNAISTAMLQLSRTSTDTEADAIVRETKHMLERYLAAYVETDPDAAGARTGGEAARRHTAKPK